MKKAVNPELGKPVKRVAAVEYVKPLKMGMRSKEVLWVCKMLQKKGSTIKITDEFNIGMRSAVICFQKKNKIKPTGVVDKKTWDKLSK